MKEDINYRIIKQLHDRKYGKHISSFLVDAIREEFGKREQRRWNFRETYDRLIEKYADQEDTQK